MKKSAVIIFVLILFSSFLQIDCKKESPIIPPTTNPLHLTAEDATCTEAFLKISLAASEVNRTVTLKRGDSSIATITMAGNDSLFVDERLLPKKTYTYSLIKDSWSATAQATTQDTTSHNVQWQMPDTLGAQGLIRDVWVFSKTDAWAVGEIYLKDSTGKIDNANKYNAAHWDGIKWELKKILVKDFGTGTGYYQLYAIFAFGPNDIWFAGDGDFIHWDGTKFTSKAFFVTQLPFNGQVRKIWGTSSNKLFCVGRTGSIYHYTGVNNWTKIESNTTVDLDDIWGIDETHIWSTGTTASNGHSVVLQYDGTKWTTIYDNINKPLNEKFGFNTVWTDQIDQIYLAGESYTRVMNLTNKTFRLMNNPAQWMASRIRGIGERDIFEARSGSECLHFNGVGWYIYPELKTFNKGDVDFLTLQPTSDFILIGGFFYTGLNGIPIVVRGYR